MKFLKFAGAVLTGAVAAWFCATRLHPVIGVAIFLCVILYAIWETAQSTKDQPFHLSP